MIEALVGMLGGSKRGIRRGEDVHKCMWKSNTSAINKSISCSFYNREQICVFGVEYYILYCFLESL